MDAQLHPPTEPAQRRRPFAVVDHRAQWMLPIDTIPTTIEARLNREAMFAIQLTDAIR